MEWSLSRQEQLVLSSSWDGSVRLWDPRALTCLAVFGGHVGNVYTVRWSPHLPHTFASVAGALVLFVLISRRRFECAVVAVLIMNLQLSLSLSLSLSLRHVTVCPFVHLKCSKKPY